MNALNSVLNSTHDLVYAPTRPNEYRYQNDDFDHESDFNCPREPIQRFNPFFGCIKHLFRVVLVDTSIKITAFLETQLEYLVQSILQHIVLPLCIGESGKQNRGDNDYDHSLNCDKNDLYHSGANPKDG